MKWPVSNRDWNLRALFKTAYRDGLENTVSNRMRRGRPVRQRLQFFFEIIEWIKITAFKKIHFCVLIIIWCLFLTASLLQLIVFNVVLSPVRWFSDAETFWLKKSNQVIVDFIWITLSPLPSSPFQVTDVKS